MNSNNISEGNETRKRSQDIIDTMIMAANLAIENGDYKLAVKTYKAILELQPDEAAQYNLGTLYAQGKGVKQDFMEAAYWFNQAGDEQSKKLCMKCMMDLIHQDFQNKTSEQIYFDVVRFVKFIWPLKDLELEVNRNCI